MRYYLSLIGIFISTCLFAQNNTFEIKRCSAVIKGNVKNNTSQFLEFAQTGYFNNEFGVSVPIDKNGNFNKTIWFDGDIQDLYLYLNNDAITIDVQKNDTIEINWDAKDFNNTFKLKSTDKIRNNELQTMLALYNKYRKPTLDLSRSLYTEKWSDSLKFSKINDLYNQELQTVFDNKATHTKVLNDIYYQFVSLMQSNGLLRAYSLTITDTTGKSNLLYPLIHNFIDYRSQSEEAFLESANYRNFLFDYVRLYKPFNSASLEGSDYEHKAVPFSAPWVDYYSGLANFSLYQLRDWYIARSIMFDFQFYSFNDAEAVYKDFVSKIKVPAYADTLAIFYKNAKNLKPGNMAPNFTLTGVDGKPVSLSDMRGKVVFVDFWGVGCGPCMYDIKNNAPQLHEKYKDKNIVFVNICVDSHEAEWKNSLKETGLSGTNLIAEGWNKNSEIKPYGIQGIPHYIIIDANGKIVDNNSPGPSQSNSLYAELDKAIGK
jgi:peroxiredoxin